MFRGLKIALFHLTGAGIVLVFGALMMIVDSGVPTAVILAMTIGIAFIVAVFATRLLMFILEKF